MHISKGQAFALVEGVAVVERERREILASALDQINLWRESENQERFASFPQGSRQSPTKCAVAVAIGYGCAVMPMYSSAEGDVSFTLKDHLALAERFSQLLGSAIVATLPNRRTRVRLPVALGLVAYLFDHGFYPELEAAKDV